MFLNLFKKKKENTDNIKPNPNIARYYMDTHPYKERRDDVYDYARIYPNDESDFDSDTLLSFSYDIICKLAENNNLCYYVEYDENQHREVVEQLKINFDKGDVYSIIYSTTVPLLCIRQNKPTVEIMAKAGKNGFSYASGVDAYIYKGVPEFSKSIVNNAVGLLGADKQYMINISVDDYTGFIHFKYDKAKISFDDIRKLAEETAPKYGKYIEVTNPVHSQRRKNNESNK